MDHYINEPERRAPTVDAPSINNTIGYLQGVGTWRNASEIAHAWGFGTGERGKRFVRAIAAKDSRIISGQEGYQILTEHCVPAAEKCARTLESQAAVMRERAAAIRRRIISLVRSRAESGVNRRK